MAHMMPLAESACTAWKAASAVSMMQRPPQRRRNRARPRPDLDDAPVLVVPHHHAARVAREPLRRFRGNARAALEDRLTGLLGVLEHCGIDVHHHLVTLARRARIQLVVERRLCEQRQRVRLLLSQRRRRVLRGRVRRRIGYRLRSSLLVQSLARGSEGPHEESAGLGREPAPQHDRAVVVLVHVKRTARMLTRGLPRLRPAIHLTPPADDALDVGGGARLSDSEQPLLGLGGSDAGERANLGV